MYIMAHLAQDAKTKTGLCGFCIKTHASTWRKHFW